MNVVLYARVSSEKQAEKDLSLPAQLKALREYALKRNWTIVEEYVDEAESARTADRPAFQKMIAATKQKNIPFETILVWKLNRFARNREDSIIYKSLLRKRGVQVISINENFDDGPSGRLLEGIIAERPAGGEGFGYDPIFVPKGHQKTLAEMVESEKNAISHRAKAVQELMEQVKRHSIVLAKP